MFVWNSLCWELIVFPDCLLDTPFASIRKTTITTSHPSKDITIFGFLQEDSSVESDVDSGVRTGKLSSGNALVYSVIDNADGERTAIAAAAELGDAANHRLEEMGLAELEQRARALKALMAKLEKDKTVEVTGSQPAPTDAQHITEDSMLSQSSVGAVKEKVNKHLQRMLLQIAYVILHFVALTKTYVITVNIFC